MSDSCCTVPEKKIDWLLWCSLITVILFYILHWQFGNFLNFSAYLATFAEFLILNKESDYIQNVIKEGLRAFVETMILQYKEEIKTVPVHFAGSIAFFTQEEIKEVAQEYGFTVGNFERRPIEGLVNYHAEIVRSS